MFVFFRILVFSPGSVTNVEVYIDEVHAGKAKHEEGPLYVVSWRPEKYSEGLHSIRVVVQVTSNELRQGPCFRYIDTTIPLLPKSESSNL